MTQAEIRHKCEALVAAYRQGRIGSDRSQARLQFCATIRRRQDAANPMDAVSYAGFLMSFHISSATGATPITPIMGFPS